MSDPIKFRAKIEDNTIWVWAVGKWRPLRYYNRKNKIPSQRLQQEVIGSVLANCGEKSRQFFRSKWYVYYDASDGVIPVELDFNEG